MFNKFADKEKKFHFECADSVSYHTQVPFLRIRIEG